MTNFIENPTKVRGLTLDAISPNRKKVKIRLVMKDRIERLVFTLINIFYLPSSPSNLINLGLQNNVGIYHHKKDKILYDLEI